MDDNTNQLQTRRDLLLHVSRGGFALGAMSTILSAPVTAADPAKQESAPSSALQITDFDRSCLRFRIDTTKKPPKSVSKKMPMTLNNVRFLLEARTVITHKSTGRVYDYVLTASCKSEQVWVKKDVWHQPNADMCAMVGIDEFLIFKRWDKANKGVMLHPASLGEQPERQLDDPKELFDSYSIDLTTRPGRVLETIDDTIETLRTNTPVISHTEYETPEYQVRLEYPVKCVNFSERERYYQVDTGPVLLPDLAGKYKSPLEGCRLAFVAHNEPGWAEFIACTHTPLNDEIKVHHYSDIIRIENTRNRMIAVV